MYYYYVFALVLVLVCITYYCITTTTTTTTSIITSYYYYYIILLTEMRQQLSTQKQSQRSLLTSITYNKINLDEMRRKNMPDDGVFNISQNSNHNVDNDVESNDSQVNLKDVDDNGDG